MPQLFRRLSAIAVFVVLNVLVYPALGNPVEPTPPAPTLTAARTLQHSPPPGVSDNYVITPNGYFDPACVKRVGDGAAILGNNSIRHADGSIETMTGCPSPHFKKDGTRVEGNLSPQNQQSTKSNVPRYEGWVEFAYNVYNVGASLLYTNWTVPQTPPQLDDQTIFLFAGLEPSDQSFILQPVLGFNGFSSYPDQWTIESWNCCPNGNAIYSTPVIVYPGETIYGQAYSTDVNSYLSQSGNNYYNGNCSKIGPVGYFCPFWGIIIGTASASTTLYTDLAWSGEPMVFVAGGVMETYNIRNCAQYPPSGGVAFNYPLVYSAAGYYLQVANDPYFGFGSWLPQYGNGVVACNYFVAQSPPYAGEPFLEPAIVLYWTP